MEIIGLEKDERILVRAEKSAGRVLWTIVGEVIALILWFAVIDPLLFRWAVSQYSISYESWGDLIVSTISAKAADYALGITFSVVNGLFVLEAVITVVFALIRHTRRELYLTDRRIFGHTGNLLLGKREINLPLSQITGIKVRQGVIANLFRYGIVDIDTPLGRYSVDGIGDPNRFVSVYQKQKVFIDPDQNARHEELENEYLQYLEQEKETEKKTGIFQSADASFLINTKKTTYKTTWQCVCGSCNSVGLAKCGACGRSVLQSQEEKQKGIAEEYREFLEDRGVSYHKLTGEPVLEKRERYYIITAAILYMLSAIFSITAYNANAAIESASVELESALPSSFGFFQPICVLLSVLLSVFLAAMAVKMKYWALCVVKVGMILGAVMNIISFIAALPALFAPGSWLLSPIGIGIFLGMVFYIFIGVMVIKRKFWAFRVMQVLLILRMVVNGVAFIGALPTFSAMTYFSALTYDVVAFCLINAGTAALSEMVQSSRRRLKA